ncbi:MAG: sulfatase [Planctomycetota bacterium]
MKRILANLLSVAVAVVCCLTSDIQAQSTESSTPNIVFFLADDHGIHQCAPYGETQARTPFMDSMASQGIRFDNAFIASPACGPSRGALLSGLMPARNGAEGNHMAPKPATQSMVRCMQDAGYEVAAIGKVGHGRHISYSKCDYVFSGRKGSLAKDVGEFLRKRTSKKPLFLLVGDRRPHVPWTKEMQYDPEKVDLPHYLIDTPETREHWARYLTDVSAMDSEMEAIDRLVRDYFGSDDYIALYSSDHGAQWPFGKWNLYDYGARVPFLVRWPGHIEARTNTKAMISWVDIFPTLIELVGGEVTEGIDGRSFAEVLAGRSDKHRDMVFTTHTCDKKMNVYPIRAVRDQSFKYIRNLYPDHYHSNHSDTHRKDGAGAYWHSWDERAKTDPQAAAIIKSYYQRPPEEFYDIASDPNETNNLINDPEYAEKIAAMSGDLDMWMKAQGDTGRIFSAPYPLSGPTPYELAP